MNITQELIALAQERLKPATMTALAEALDVSKQSVSQWRNGDREIERADVIAQVCLVIGEDPATWFAKFAGERTASANVKKWARRAGSAAALFVGVLTAGAFSALPHTAYASEAAALDRYSAGNIHYALSRMVRRVVRKIRGRIEKLSSWHGATQPLGCAAACVARGNHRGNR